MLDEISPKVMDSNTIQFLARPYTKEERVGELVEMHPSKAPGPDGLPEGFYKHFWMIVKTDVVSYWLNVLNHSFSMQAVNETNIALIPKTKTPVTMKVSTHQLLYVIYKLISKIVETRLRTVLPDVISEEQSAFIKGWQITDNVIVAYEFLHKLRGKRYGRTCNSALNLDISKAYD